MATTHIVTSTGSDARSAVVQVNNLIANLDPFLTSTTMDQVMPAATLAGLSADASAEDVETDNTIILRSAGLQYVRTAVSAIDISAKMAAATITGSTYGVGYAFLDGGTGTDFEVPITTQADTSEIAALARWAIATRTLPPAVGMVPIGHVSIAAAGGGYTWGTTSTAGVSTFVDYGGRPGVEVAAASLALDAGAATFTYGAVTARLGSQVRVAATGKTGVTVPVGTINNSYCGAYLIYVLADDSEYALPLGLAYYSETAALAAIRDHNPNPYLPVIGYFTVLNNSGAAFTAATTFFDAAGIKTTFYKVGPGTNTRELGRGAAGQPFTVSATQIRGDDGNVITQE